MSYINQVFRGISLSTALWIATSGQAHASLIYASNFNSNTITAYDFTTGALLGTPVVAGAEANGFNGIVALGSSFLVAAQTTNNIVRYGSDGALLNIFDPSNTAGLSSPQDQVLGPNGRLYVVSSENDRILTYDPATGAFLSTFADLSANGHLGPVGLAFGPSGNLYVTSFDNDQVVVLNGQTGAILSSTPGPAGTGFGPAAFGPDGNLYIDAIDLSTFAGSVYRFNPGTKALDVFISQGRGGLQSPGGLAFGPGGTLLVSNLIFDQNFIDTGSTILEYNGQTGAFLRTAVGPGNGLSIPFFITVSQPVPEPSTIALFAIGAIVLCIRKLTPQG